MTNSNRHIRINDEVFALHELETVAAEKLQTELTDWEQDFYRFAIEWFDSRDFVELNTSGSTGIPKTIRLPKTMMRRSAARTLQYFNIKDDEQLLLSLSCRYIAGKMMLVRALCGNHSLVVVDPSSDFRFLQHEKYGLGAVVPLQLGKMLENSSAFVENIRCLLVGGSAVPAALEEQIRGLKNEIVSTYGMTETASHIALRHLSGSKASPNYCALPGIVLRCNAGGCLEIQENPNDDWLTTTDLVEMLSPTEFTILGRADDAIISGGLKFHPAQIEKKLQKHISVPFFISSEEDEKLGARLILIVEGKDSPELRAQIETVCQLELQKFEQARKIVFVEKIPRTETGKIVRRK